MRPLTRLLWKEGRELLRPQYILPLLLIPIMFVGMGQVMGGFSEELADEPSVGLVNADGDELGAVAERSIESNADVVYNATEPPEDPQATAETIHDRDGEALLVIPEDFTERIRAGEQATVRVYTPIETVSFLSVAASGQTESLISAAERNVTLAATNATAETLDPATREHVTYMKGQRFDTSPVAITGTLTQQFLFVPLIIAFVLMFSGQMVIQSMGIETENRTLETLLTMPVERWKLVTAKLTAGGVIGLVATVLYTGGIVVYQASLSAFGTGADVAFALGPLDYLFVAVSLFFTLIGMLAMVLSLGLFVDDRQGAQLLLLPILLLLSVPVVATMLADFDTLPLLWQGVLFVIPFTHPIIAPKRLLFEDMGLVLAGIAYEIVFAAAMIVLATRLFQSDRLVTGVSGRLGKLLDTLQR
jgi:ABC-2 type transport system permease protein